MPTTPLLSVCISTRNRAKYIRETLESVLSQGDSDVEVLVFDGASTDGTPDVVRSLQQEHPRLRLVEATANGGLDADFDRAVEASTGRYCWLFSDDDLFVPGAIDEVRACLENEPAAVIVDAAVYGPDFVRCHQTRRLAFTGRRVFTEAQSAELFLETARHLSFIGALVVRRDFWLSRVRTPYYGTYFLHLGVLFQAPIPGEVVVLGEPLVKIRYGLASWSNLSFEIWMYKFPDLVWSFSWLPEEVRAAVIPRAPWKTLKRLVAMRAIGAYGQKQFDEIVAPRAARPSDLRIPRLVARLPGVLTYVITRVGAYVRSPNDYSHVVLDQSPFRRGKAR